MDTRESVWILAMVLGCSRPDSGAPTTKEQLGARLFNDPRLSEPAGQACADCHDPTLAFVDPEGDRISFGVIRSRAGTRNAPTVMYTQFVPPLHRDAATGRMIGGLFWDGHANTLEEQAGAPLLNPLEMNNPSKAAVVAKLRTHYAPQFRAVFGHDALHDVDRGFAYATEALAAFERAPAMSPFSSKYDRYLAGKADLDASEARGLAIFEDPKRGDCASCHPSRPAADGTPPLFTNFAYENIGLPRFADNPFYLLPRDLNPEGTAFIDHGLAQTTHDPQHDGMFRVPTLRNITKTSPYGHNGYVRRLDEMIEILTASCSHSATCELPPPEVSTNALRTRSSTTGMPRQDVLDLVAFLRTLDDD